MYTKKERNCLNAGSSGAQFSHVVPVGVVVDEVEPAAELLEAGSDCGGHDGQRGRAYRDPQRHPLDELPRPVDVGGVLVSVALALLVHQAEVGTAAL